ncbi:MAG TPA: S8 family serine peptidase [Pyrinomonadaceae bacterium]|nr:S8 family serine peptidase [Pyrinomonadaceae bacterium]
MKVKLPNSLQKALSLALALFLSAGPVAAGILIRGTEGITMTGADGVYFEDLNGITMTGADGLLGLKVNGVTLPVTTDGITMTGADGVTYTGANAVGAVNADGITMTGADGITMTGADGITMTGADGTSYVANSVIVRQANGITMTGADGITMTGADGLQMLGLDGITVTGADGITMTGADGITMTGADSVTIVTRDGKVFSVSPNGITMTGADGITMTGADGITMTGADGITMTGADGIGGAVATGLQGLDPELALLLNKVTDDSTINAVVTFHHYPTDADLASMRTLGITGGTRFRKLPMIIFSALPSQIAKLSQLPAVRSVWGNRTLQWNAEQTSALTGTGRVYGDADLTRKNRGLAVTGRGVTVAVLDTGLDGTHADVAGRVVSNVKLADLQGLSPLGFQYPANVQGLPNTDLLAGHGTFVSGIIAGNGARSNGRYQGVAPNAKLVGLSAGDANLLFVLAGFDYLLTQGPTLRVRVVNCSFSANTVYDPNDPVNVATKMLTDQNVSVVFSAGNTGPGADSLNPYALAPWVISAGATDARGRLAQFSSRGAFGSTFRRRPTLVAPGVDMISLRAAGLNQTGLNGLSSGADTRLLSLGDLLSYTAGSGTSFSAPVVAGTIALMLEANPNLKPAQVRDILQRTATPLPSNFAHEAGAGVLNAHAAVLEAAFPARRMGMWRATLNRGQVRFVKNAPRTFTGTVQPGLISTTNLTIPTNTVAASVRVAWGPLLTTNDLGMKVYDGGGVLRSHVNVLNLPGLTGRGEGTQLNSPAAGTWRVQVFNTLGLLGLLPQPYVGRLDVERVEYAPLLDISGLSASAQNDIRQNLRSFVMMPVGNRFFPSWPVTRGEFAATLVRGARVPQYMPGVPTYSDVRSSELMNFVESVQKAPGGPLFYDAPAGGPFYPDRSVRRLAAAIALVRAAGLRAAAENYTGPMPALADIHTIPVEYRGYVAIAHTRGLLKASGGYFSPQSALTRVHLAQAMVVLAKLAS